MKTQPITKNTVTIEGRALGAALKTLMSIIERRNTYPILSTVRLAVSGATLTITATNLDIEITTQIDVNDAEGDWQMCVSPMVLSGIARVAGVALMKIERAQVLSDGLKPVIDHTCVVTIGDDAEYTTHTLEADNWPDLPGKRGDLIERFTNGMLAQMLAKVSPFISNEETRYYLNGVHWQSTGTRGRRFQATDGHRLASCRYTDGGGAVFSCIIPRKAVALIQRATAGQDVAVYAVAGKEAIDIVCGRTTIRTKLIESTFPDTDRVTPAIDGNPIKLEMNRQDILAAIDRVSVVASSRYGRALRWFENDGKLSLSCRNSDLGDATATTAIDWSPDATTRDFGLNAAYIRSMIAGAQGNVTLHVKDAGAPFLLTDEDEQMTRVLMPMRV